MDRKYSNGRELEKAIEDRTPPDEAASPYVGLFAKQQRSKRRFHALTIVTLWACDELPVGPVVEQAQERFNNLEMGTFGRENVALAMLQEADWELAQEGAPRNQEDVIERAIRLKDAELRRDPSKEAYYSLGVDDAIRELAGGSRHFLTFRAIGPGYRQRRNPARFPRRRSHSALPASGWWLDAIRAGCGASQRALTRRQAEAESGPSPRSG